MDNWDASVVYQIVATQHRERIARGEAAQRLATLLGQQPLRTRLAAVLVALAMRLDPAHLPALIPDRSATRTAQ